MAAEACEWRGGIVVVCEESYTRRLVPGARIAMALGGHNGSGRWFPGGPERFESLGLALRAWRKTGSEILICASRGMGSETMREPRGWAEDVQKRLRKLTRRPLRLRRHPGKAPATPLCEDIERVWAVVVWASNCATEALTQGVPVFYEAPHIVTAGAAECDLASIEQPSFPDRRPVFEQLAWAQWTLEEVAAGAAFRHLLGRSLQA